MLNAEWFAGGLARDVRDHRNRSGYWRHPGRLPDGARECEGADSAGRADPDRRRRDRHGANRELIARAEENCRRVRAGVRRIEIHEATVSAYTEDDVRAFRPAHDHERQHGAVEGITSKGGQRGTEFRKTQESYGHDRDE